MEGSISNSAIVTRLSGTSNPDNASMTPATSARCRGSFDEAHLHVVGQGKGKPGATGLGAQRRAQQVAIGRRNRVLGVDRLGLSRPSVKDLGTGSARYLHITATDEVAFSADFDGRAMLAR